MSRAMMVMMLMTVVIWNLQRVSLREQNRGRLRRVAEWVKQRGWEVVLIMELFGEEEGVIWMGENEHRNGRLLIGGDWNANVGRGSERNGVCGEFGVGRMNNADIDLIEWCGVNGLAYMNSFVRHAERGTWFNRMHGRWYELDGFVVKQNERHCMIRRIRSERKNELSDHKPKKVMICVEKRWRAVNGERKRRIIWEVLRDSEKKEEYKESTRVKME